jgi:exodeoxyribonuclease VII large subunit
MAEKQGAHVYTVTELTRDIRFVLEDTFDEVWVEGEISNFTVSAAGHAYFSMKDESSILNCVIFKGNGARITFDIEDGLHVLCHGRVSVYGKKGAYQLYVDRMEPKGKGALQLAFEQLKKKLLKEGLFDEERKKTIPFLPARVGVVTSPTGAAIRDILKVAKRRYSNVEITIRPVKVQGEGAGEEIAGAIKELNEFNRLLKKRPGEEHPIDVIIVGRGGGSLEDLWAFNEEAVARAIFASEIPVISAVGHEIDYTISDFVADLRAPTPSAAAELVVPRKSDLMERVLECRRRLYAAAKKRVNALETTVENLKGSYVLRAPTNVLLQLRQQVDDLAKLATSSLTHLVEINGKKWETAAGKLHALSPLAVLERGYSITFRDEKVVKEAARVAKGDILETRLFRGKVKSRIESVEK